MKPALLLVDVQEDFLARPGLSPEREVVIAGIAVWLQAFRSAGLPVLHLRTQMREDGGDRMPHWAAAGTRVCVAGSLGVLPPGPLTETVGEPVFSKRFYSGFEDAELQPTLARLGIGHLFIAGLYTHACVRQTALDAYARGMRVTLAADAIASTEPPHAALTLDYLAGRGLSARNLAEAAVDFGIKPPQPLPQGSIWPMRNPANFREILAEIPLGTAEDVVQCRARTAERQPGWAAMPLASRHEALANWLEAIVAGRRELVDCIVLDVGKPITQAEAEFDYALALARHTLASMISDHERHDGFNLRYAPLGTVGIVSPWNNPLAIPLGKLAPCLAWGNAAIWKPALPGSRVAAMLKAFADAALPDAPFELLTGDAGTGALLLARGQLDAASFTGSSRQGALVARLFADRCKPLQSELGGNNAVIVAADADPRAVAEQLVPAMYSYAGQRCTAPRRIIVDATIRRALEQAMLDAIDRLRIGEPGDPQTQVGPLVTQERRAEIERAVGGADGKLLCGGCVPAGLEHGAWYAPTLIGDPDLGSAIVQEECFGPVAVLLSSRDLDDAIAMANGVPHGLVTTVFSDQPEVLRRVADEACSGIVCANRGLAPIAAQAPFLGWKQSGAGLPEHGRWDKDMYTRPQAHYSGP